jgi:hypothetical protein
MKKKTEVEQAWEAIMLRSNTGRLHVMMDKTTPEEAEQDYKLLLLELERLEIVLGKKPSQKRLC